MKIQDISLFESYSTAKQVFAREASPEEVGKRLDQFKQLNQRNMLKPEEKDLGKWIRAGWQSFSSFVADASGRTSGKAEKKAKRGDSIRVYENNNWLVVIPLSKDASCFYGKGTQWCTAATQSNNFFDEYFKLHVTLFYFLSKEDGSKLAAAHSPPDTIECFDAEDKKIALGELLSIVGISGDQLKAWTQQHRSKIEDARGKVPRTLRDVEMLSDHINDLLRSLVRVVYTDYDALRGAIFHSTDDAYSNNKIEMRKKKLLSHREVVNQIKEIIKTQGDFSNPELNDTFSDLLASARVYKKLEILEKLFAAPERPDFSFEILYDQDEKEYY